jgi:3-phenylpropionate/trans-cinnamate dioxygenase ferredoxin reductase component
MTRYLIVGCGPTGANAAEEIRQLDPQATITMISHERLCVVSRPRLVDYCTLQIEAEALQTRQPDWFEEHRIELRLNVVAVSLDPLGHTVKLATGETLAYDRCLLSVGITPRDVPFPGADLQGVGQMHYLDQADRVRTAIEKSDHTVVIGGGLLGQDMTAALRKAGRSATMLVREDYVGHPLFDRVSGDMLCQELRRLGAEVHLSTEVAEIRGSGGRVSGVVLREGRELSCQAVFCAIGAVPNADWLASSGLKVQQGIVVDSHLRTNLPDVFAAGSGTEYHLRRIRMMQASWGNAMAAGKVAARNMTGAEEVYEVPSDYSTRVGEKKFTLFGAHRSDYPKARYVGFRGDEGGYAALLEENGVVRGGVLVGKHQRTKDIKRLQLLGEPVPHLAKLPDQNDTSVSEFVAKAMNLQ